jgi:predicted transcriptional regulator
MLTKEMVLSSVAELPNQFSIDDFVERLITIEKIEIGLEQVKKGMLLTQEEVKDKIKSWRK